MATLVVAVGLVAQGGPAAAVSREAPAPALLSTVVVDGVRRDVYVVPCVTTTWRAEHWHRARGPVGSVCFKADRDTWIPKAWPRLGYVVVGGNLRPVFLRTV